MPEAKIVRCTRGAMFDVVIDLRADSPTRLQWFGVELTQDNGLGIYIPAGFAHGFITLAPDTEVLYMMDQFHAPDRATGARWNDPAFGISWPLAPEIMSEKDASWPDYA
jgi:dTDP-4-dehydrorhamnose 3,5-epimerase